MKTQIFVIGFILLLFKNQIKAQSGTLIDQRDGKIYKTIQIGTQLWMAENLAYKITLSEVYPNIINNPHKNPNAPQFECYNGIDSNCTKYGALYNWYVATKACPVGWHLPTKAEYDTLLKFVGNGNPEKALMALTVGGSSGFEGLYGGCIQFKYGGLGYSGLFWTSTRSKGMIPLCLSKFYNGAFTSIRPNKVVGVRKEDYMSVRCIMD